MGSQLTRNLSLTFIMVIILTFIFVPNIQVTFHGVIAIFNYINIFNQAFLISLGIHSNARMCVIYGIGFVWILLLSWVLGRIRNNHNHNFECWTCHRLLCSHFNCVHVLHGQLLIKSLYQICMFQDKQSYDIDQLIEPFIDYLRMGLGMKRRKELWEKWEGRYSTVVFLPFLLL